MGLVIKDGKLLIKDGGLATATRPSEACDCCGDTPVVGKCCEYPYSNSGPQPANTAEEAIQLASQSASANSAAIPNSIWTVGTPAGVPWVEGEAWYDEARNQYECTGYWTLGEPGECSQQTEAGCLSGPFKYFTPGETCEGSDDCPAEPPTPTPGTCLYREDGLGSCYMWYDGLTGNCDYESAEAAEEGAANDAAPYTNGAWWYVYPNNPDDISEGWCYELFYRDPGWEEPQPAGTSTEENCKASTLSPINPGAEKGGQSLTQEEVQSAYDELIGSTWVNDKPADKCKTVNSEDECTESTGVFCANVTNCNQIDFDQGCPEWGCCLFCPEQPSSLPCGCADGYVRYGNDNPCGTAGIFQPEKTCKDLGYESNRSNPLP